LAGVEQAGIEPDLARTRLRARDVPRDVDRDPHGDQAPAEAARVQRGTHLRLLWERAAVEDVVAAACTRHAREAESCHGRGYEEREAAAHALVFCSALAARDVPHRLPVRALPGHE